MRFGDVFFGKLRDAVKLIPKQAELLVDGFLFLLAAVGGSYPFVVFDDTDMQGRVVGMGDDFDDPQDGKGVYEPEGFSDRPAENAAPVAVAEHAFASFAQVVFVLPVAVYRVRIVYFHQDFQERFYFSGFYVRVFYLLL